MPHCIEKTHDQKHEQNWNSMKFNSLHIVQIFKSRAHGSRPEQHAWQETSRSRQEFRGQSLSND